jgi:predicted dienelactone hydrolase
MRCAAFVLAVVAVVVSSCADEDGATSPTEQSTGAVATSLPEVDVSIGSTTVPTTTSTGGTSGTTTATTGPDATTGTTLTPTAPAQLEMRDVTNGPYVAAATTVLLDDPERPLTVEVWFPVRAAERRPAHRYEFPGAFYESPNAVSAEPRAIAPEGPYPLVVYSHGSGGQRYFSSFLAEALAAHGYVVAAADHSGDTALDRILGTADPTRRVVPNRLDDVTRVIDALTDPSSPVGQVAEQVDPDYVAVTGHSLGGLTAYALVSGLQQEDVAAAPDSRVDVIVPVAPATSGLSDDELAAVDVPTMVIGGTSDSTTPIDPNVTRPWALSAADPHHRADLVAAEHESFTDVCEYIDSTETQVDVSPVVLDVLDERSGEACEPTAMASSRVHELTSTFAIRFLDHVFGGEPALDPELETTGDDVDYQAAGSSD